jgi:hypothetical protein
MKIRATPKRRSRLPLMGKSKIAFPAEMTRVKDITDHELLGIFCGCQQATRRHRRNPHAPGKVAQKEVYPEPGIDRACTKGGPVLSPTEMV